MISISIIECIEADLVHHLIFIGIQMNSGGIGLVTTNLIMDLIKETVSDLMETLVGMVIIIGAMVIAGIILIIDGEIFTTLGIGTTGVIDMDGITHIIINPKIEETFHTVKVEEVLLTHQK
tara:strand:- start:319 stop:681 length:363 start_codon:yes stop_codon:yes gene_type:complete